MTNQPFMYTAAELFNWLGEKPDFILLDVRNENDFAHWSVEGPHLCPYINIPYYNFIEDVAESVALVPQGEKVRIVCSKEGSAKYVAELLIKNNFTDVGYLQDGIVGWGKAVIPKKVTQKDAPYQLYQCIRPGKASISYILCSNEEAFVIDPSRNTSVYLQKAEEHGCTITKTFETHRQADYISGGQILNKEANATIMANSSDFEGADFPYESVTDGAEYSCGGISVRAIHTPGHTMGSTCYIVDEKFLLTGDTLFITTAGRPDLGGKWESWARVLYLTLTVKMRDLDNDLLVLPAHYSSWAEANENLLFCESLGKLREQVDAYTIPNELKFKEFIHENMRPQPGVYAEIRRVNGGWLDPTPDEADVMDLGKNECGASNYGKVGMSGEVTRQQADDRVS